MASQLAWAWSTRVSPMLPSSSVVARLAGGIAAAGNARAKRNQGEEQDSSNELPPESSHNSATPACKRAARDRHCGQCCGNA
ncbi:hypothetical protein D3C76_1696930 [compost metagenome]